MDMSTYQIHMDKETLLGYICKYPWKNNTLEFNIGNTKNKAIFYYSFMIYFMTKTSQ